MTRSKDTGHTVAEHGQWYHTLELGPGLTTPGWFDLRGVPDRIAFPVDLAGARCLDVGTFDGFWSFEMERRGADEVVAIDLLDEADWDWPATAAQRTVDAVGRRKRAGSGFEIARSALGSDVQRHELSVYDLTPERLGTFDFVYLGSLLLHLKNPIGALEAVRSVCRGTALVMDAVGLTTSILHPRQPLATLEAQGRPWWWRPNRAGLVRMVESAGFGLAAEPVFVRIPAGAGQHRPGAVDTIRSLRHRGGREAIGRIWFGDPHVALSVRPLAIGDGLA